VTDKSNDERFMRAALREARKAFGKTSPNPAVGAVLVDGKKIIAQGFHRGPGQPHAEIECLRGVSAKARARSTLYVTLEPCSTAGRTGACTEALIAGGIKHVVVGAIDPNPRHNGRGLARLREAGVEARSGILAAECAALNEAFNKWTVTGLPFVIAKCGMGLDGCLTRPPDEPRWITSPAARRDGRLLRARMDAVLIGAETLRADNPRLTAREERGSRQPWRIILTRSGKLPANARVFRDRFRDRTVVFRNEKLENVLRELGRREITSVLIEGGGQILAEALDARLIDQFQIYIGPILTGGPVVAFPGDGAANSSDALRLERVTYRRIENDICVTGFAAVEKTQKR
jgi:diaminohydroxyphosphoribosylaminopyrimidine deaminase/5-amino-6-(5-phosphoribosylamino)uracil reductase